MREVIQQERERRFDEMIERVLLFTERETNLREKVRARHLFSRLTEVSSQENLTGRQEELFRIWYVLDYLNIQGTRNLDRFLAKYRSELSGKEIELVGSLLASYFSVFKRKGVGENPVLESVSMAHLPICWSWKTGISLMWSLPVTSFVRSRWDSIMSLWARWCLLRKRGLPVWKVGCIRSFQPITLGSYHGGWGCNIGELG
ncbi:hypothetical protein GCM10011571_12670 [Marinithermofilum abyssi]|uniref:Uncharacterized protein n=1 Tax=Marinithermofilum abyssi TaxID=1571185 RepID=A0A8J2VEP6_9BACL|nr:hypothetical protein [Marinithermofilum abyssi]GGE12723.1 hypothetical protein GCM10011571_12670 [Marinithermofilum abyssi]